MEYRVERIEMERQDTAMVRDTVAHEAIPAFLSGAYGEVLDVLRAQGLEPSGPPFGCYVLAGDRLEVEAGFPVSGPVRPEGRVVPGETPAGWVALTLYRGPYEGVPAAYAAVEQWLAEQEWEPSGPGWESYLDGPEVAQPRTVVHMPCRPR